MKAIILALMLFGGCKPRMELYCEKPLRLAYKYKIYYYEPIF